MSMLVLFDIDGTLLRAYGEGIRAMEDAGSELLGRSFSIDGINYAGSLDPLIWQRLCEMNGVENADELHDDFRSRYAHHLTRRLRAGAKVDQMPGVAELLNRLASMQSVTLGLVTGNYPETGQLKIETAGLDFGLFGPCGWGCDGEHRRELPLVAIKRHEQAGGQLVDHTEVVIIGDTPHDVDCALYSGCRSLAVATGVFDMDELAPHEPDHLVKDLSNVEEVLAWILRNTTSKRGIVRAAQPRR